ncbi:pyridoxal phosphate-dependent transferase [Penicillium waksmanii]|uniref:pyridoxal phosphate-dependent transferase n=1 Tax=Penicillium waksmanii TaxID=69791 RepID=UPI002546E7B3|nr:pyridoxal phosphate-dependent transferase [Penicillium waksmanii]KAJ5988358.1 pyridoxal phosphate-dependent transferase [Penicillium waksmanii]
MLEINELVSKARGEGKHVVHLGFGEATFPIQRKVLQAHKEASTETSYMPVAGLETLRTSIASFNADRLGVKISPNQVVVAPGSKSLLFALFDILDGAVLLPRPSWVSYEPQVLHAGKRLFWVETDAVDRHTITKLSLLSLYEKAVSEDQVPRIMLVNSPSNPTGHVFSTSCAQTIKDFWKSKGIILITDEIYSDICFDESQKGISAFDSATDDPETVILSGGLSKTYSAGGWRVGYAIFPRRNKEISSARQSLNMLPNAGLRHPHRPNSHPSKLSLRVKICLYSALKELGLDVGQPGGAFYVYPADLSAWLIRECGLAALPGSAFGEDDNGPLHGRFRLRMATSYLYFQNEVDRYEKGYDILERCASGEEIQLPYLEEAIRSLENAVRKLRNVGL